MKLSITQTGEIKDLWGMPISIEVTTLAFPFNQILRLCCNKYEEDKKKGILPEEEMRALELKEDVDLYLECYRKYQNSQIRLREVKNLVDDRHKESVDLDESVISPAFLSYYFDNLNLLIQCYQTLKWLYVQCFYKKGPIIKEYAEKFEKKNQDYYHFMLNPMSNLLELSFRKSLEQRYMEMKKEIADITKLLSNI